MNEGAGQIIDGVKDLAGKAAGQAVDIKDKAYKGVQDAATMVGGKGEEGKKSVVETATVSKDKTLDAAGVAAENTEKTVSGAWDATKGAVPKKE